LAKEINEIIKITEAAGNYLHKREKLEVRIEYPNYRTSCECAFVSVPEIFAKRPKSEGEYYKTTIDGIDVFLSKYISLPEDNDIIIDVDSFLTIKTLTVSGFNTKD